MTGEKSKIENILSLDAALVVLVDIDFLALEQQEVHFALLLLVGGQKELQF